MTTPTIAYPGVGFCGSCRTIMPVEGPDSACIICGSPPTHYTPFDFALAGNGDGGAAELVDLVVDEPEPRYYSVRCPHCDGDVPMRVTASAVEVVSGEAPGKDEPSAGSDEADPAGEPPGGGPPAQETPQA